MLALLREWVDEEEPMVEAIGNELNTYAHLDTQALARRVLGVVIEIIEAHQPGEGNR